jgi:hypothetical protein
MKFIPVAHHAHNVRNRTLTSSTTKTGRHDIAEILLKVALDTKNQSINQYTARKLQTLLTQTVND